MVRTATEQAQRAPEPPGERRPVVGVVIVVVLLAVVAVGVGVYLRSSDSSSTVSAAPGAPGTVPTTVAPVPPALLTTGDNPDWRALVDSFLAYQHWLFLHPDSSRLADLFTPDYRVVSPSGEVFDLAGSKADMDMLARGDLRFEPAPTPVTAAAVNMQNRDARSASVFVRFNPKPGNRTVTRDGQVKQFPDQAGAAVFWRMVLGDDGRWRLAGVKPV